VQPKARIEGKIVLVVMNGAPPKATINNNVFLEYLD
jgi:hypothetical protein